MSDTEQLGDNGDEQEEAEEGEGSSSRCSTPEGFEEFESNQPEDDEAADADAIKQDQQYSQCELLDLCVGKKIFIKSWATELNVRIDGDGAVDAEGNEEDSAKFIVHKSNDAKFKFQNVQFDSLWLCVKDGKLTGTVEGLHLQSKLFVYYLSTDGGEPTTYSIYEPDKDDEFDIFGRFCLQHSPGFVAFDEEHKKPKVIETKCGLIADENGEIDDDAAECSYPEHIPGCSPLINHEEWGCVAAVHGCRPTGSYFTVIPVASAQ